MWTQHLQKKKDLSFPCVLSFAFLRRKKPLPRSSSADHPSRNIGPHLVTCLCLYQSPAREWDLQDWLGLVGTCPLRLEMDPTLQKLRAMGERGYISKQKQNSMKKKRWLWGRPPTVSATLTQNVITSYWAKRWGSHSRRNSI